MKGNALTYTQLALGMLIFGSATPISKIVTQEFPVFIASDFRVLLCTVALTPLLFKDGDTFHELSAGDWGKLFAIALVGLVLYSTLMLYGMKMIPGAIGSIVMSAMPAVMATASVWFMGDRMDRLKGAAIALAVLGIAILPLSNLQTAQQNPQQFGSFWLGILLIFGVVCCDVTYSLVGKTLTQKLYGAQIALVSSFIAALLFLPLAIWQWGQFDPSSVSMKAWLALLWWGASVLGLGTTLWYHGMHKVPGSVAAGFVGLMPISGLMFSYLLLGESFHWTHVVGIALELGAIFLITRSRSKEARKTQQDQEKTSSVPKFQAN